MRTSLAPLQAIVTNRLPDEARGGLIGVIGDRPSTYSRSPRMWHAALARAGLEAEYLPLDVPSGRLVQLLALMRATPAWWGANVTVPYKHAVGVHLDAVDSAADAAAGAVNTVVRTPAGRLVGANTDGVGLVSALLRGDESGPLVETLYGAAILLIGAGGAARGAAAALATLLGTGTLFVANRTRARADEIVERVRAGGARADALDEAALDDTLPHVDVLINASVCGQAGVVTHADGWSSLEPYSPLGPAAPPIVAWADGTAGDAAWRVAAAPGIAANHAHSRRRMRLLPQHAVVFDMIYAPVETVLLRHAGEVGRRAANGRGMLIGQAVEAFITHICARPLAGLGVGAAAARGPVRDAMAGAWDEPLAGARESQG